MKSSRLPDLAIRNILLCVRLTLCTCDEPSGPCPDQWAVRLGELLCFLLLQESSTFRQNARLRGSPVFADDDAISLLADLEMPGVVDDGRGIAVVWRRRWRV